MTKKLFQKYLENIVFFEKSLDNESSGEVFAVEEFLLQLVRQYSKQDEKRFEFLSKKIEVSKKVYTHYNLLTHKPLDNKFISQGAFLALICHYVLLFFQLKNFKYLNTLYKILDGLPLEPKILIPLELRIMLERFLKNAI